MKTVRLFTLILLMPAGLFLGACTSSSPISRIDANRAKYESWPLEVRQAILNGEAIKGMTPEQVEMALGRPSEIITRSAKSGDDEVWIYRKGSPLGGLGGVLKNTGISIGGGVGGVGVGTGVSGGAVGTRTEEIEVVFRDGVVSRGTSGS